MTECSCLTAGPRYPDIKTTRNVGVDETHWADVDISRCTRCNRLWLKYLVELPEFSQSGKWVSTVIDAERAETVTPETALAFIEGADWLIYGGSGYGHAGKRGKGRIPGFIFGRY